MDQNKEGMLMIDVADLAFGPVPGIGVTAKKPPASPTVFGSHLSVGAASSLRLSMSAEERTPAALKIMGLLKSCQSMYPDEASGGDMSERDENWDNNASRNIFVSPSGGISLPDKSKNLNSSLILSATEDSRVLGRGGAGKAWGSSKFGGSELGSESESAAAAAVTSSRVRHVGSRSRSRSGSSSTAANTTDIRSRVKGTGTEMEKVFSPEIQNYKHTPSLSSPLSVLGSGSSGVIPRALVPHNSAGTEVRRAVLINNVMRTSLPIFDVISPGNKLGRSPQPKTPQSSIVMTGAFVRPGVPDTKPHERLLQMERVMSYSGGPSLLLHQGKLLVIASAALLVLIDTEGSASSADRSNPGFWRNFKSFSQASEVGSEGEIFDKSSAESLPSGSEPKAIMGCEQAFLKGHTAAIGLLELSPNGAVMASAETCAKGAVMVWNILEGKRMLTFRPHTDSVTAVAFNHDSTSIVTAGTDAQRRVQIAVWDVQILATQGAPLSLVARQISEFPISKIRFSPFEDASLVSCGRENIRFFRIRKKHLPACPVQLNEFSRGFIFTDFVYNLEPGKQPLDARKPCAFFSSNRGILLKIDCMKKQIICGFQLHSGPIQSLAIHEGYAVTGGGDNRLRIWPLDFSDFLLEAQHEASVTSICVSGDGRKLSVGTAAGTLGVLNVSEHSYDTILRSHVGAITFGVARSPAAEEFVTLGKDTTIRLWDIFTGTQKYEFNSPSDDPLCAAYHPIEYSLAVGFKSGALRVFDIESTTTIIERKIQKASVTALLYVRSASFPGVREAFCSDSSSRSNDMTAGSERVGGSGSAMGGFSSGAGSAAGAGHLLLFTAGLDGNIIVYDAENEYDPLKILSAVPSPFQAIRMALSSDQRLLAVAGGTVSSITVYDTQQLVAVYRGGQIQSLAQQALRTGTEFQTLSSEGLAPSPSASPCSISSPMISTANTGASLGGTGAFSGVKLSRQSKPCDPSAILTGIAFCDDRPGGSLLITTDRHIVSLPLDSDTPQIGDEGLRKKKRSAWDSRSVRRLEFGCPVTMTRDLNSGLLFMTLQAPGGGGADTGATGSGGKVIKDKDDTPGSASKVSPGSSFRSRNQADCMAVVAARHRPFNPQKLSLSAAQIYQDHLGGVNGVCPCTPCGRIVSFDDAGSMIIWRLLDDQVTSLKASNSPSYQPQSQGITGGLNRIEMESEDLCGGNDEEEKGGVDSEDEAIKYERIQDRKKIRPPREKKEKFVNKFEMRARGLIKDFELAVKVDPDAWCTSTFPSYADDRDGFPAGPDSGPSISNNFSTVRVDRGVSLVDFYSSEKTRFPISSIFGGIEDEEESDERMVGEYGGNDERSDNLNETEMTPEDSNSDCNLSRSEDYQDDEESEDDSFGETEEAISGLSHWHSVNPDEVEIEEVDVEVMIASRVSAALDMRKQSAARAMRLIKQRVRDRRAEGLGEDIDILSGRHGAVPYDLSVTNMMVAAAPSYCPQEKILVLTDGLSVSIKNIRKGTDILLPRATIPKMVSYNNLEGFPFQLITSIGSIIQAAISPSGLFVAAVMEVSMSQGSSSASSIPPVLSAPRDSNHRTSREVFLWFHDAAAYKETQRGRSGDSNGDGPWVSLGPMGIQQVAVHSTGRSHSTNSGNTGFISCGKSLSPSCGISIDWMHDDTLVLAVSVPVRVPHSDGPKELSTVKKGKQSVSSRAIFDIAFTALCVSDLFTGGYCSFKSSDSSEAMTGAGHETRGSRPSVSVLRGVVSNLRGMRCLPSSSSLPPVPVTLPQSLVHMHATDRRVREVEGEGECPRAISVVVWGGSQLLALTFPVNRVDNGTLAYATEVDAIFRDDVGAKGPILSVDMVHYSVSQATDNDSIALDTSISQIDPQSFYTHTSSLAVHVNASILPTGNNSLADGTAASGSTLFQSHTTLGAVDSLGNVKMGLIPHTALVLRKEGTNRVGPSPLLGSYVKIPVSNASGTFRSLALSSRAPHDQRDISASASSFPSPCPSYCLALGSASVIVKVFSVSIVDSSTSSSPSFHLALLYRVNTLFVPDYLFSMPLLTPEAEDGGLLSNSSGHWTPDLLVVGCQGDIAYLPASTYSSTAVEPVSSSNTAVCKSVAVLPSVDCLTLRSALSPLGPCPRLLDSPLPGTALNIASCPAARLTAVLFKGKLQLLVSDSGVQLPFPNPTGIRSGTALASTSTTLAIGSSCGSVSLYNASTMRLIKVIVGTSGAEKERERERERMKISGGLMGPTTSIELNSCNMRASSATSQFPTTGRSPRFCVGGKVDLKLPCAKESPSPVLKMEFVCNGRALLVIHANGLVTVTNTEFIGKSDQMDYSKLTSTRDNTYSRERGRDSGCEADPSSTVYLCSSWTCTVPVKNLLDDQTTGQLLLASCSSSSDVSDTCGFFGLSFGSKVHIFKVDLPECPIPSSPGKDHVTKLF